LVGFLGEEVFSACNRGKARTMPHKFKVGDSVTLKPSVSRNVPGGV
jgi:hypothetical protein